jgi:hypothetical protein
MPERSTSILERAVTGMDPAADPALDRVRKLANRRQRTRRLLSGATALLVAGAGITFAALSFQRADGPVGPPTLPPSAVLPTVVLPAGLDISGVCRSPDRPGLVTCRQAIAIAFSGHQPLSGVRADLVDADAGLGARQLLEWWITEPVHLCTHGVPYVSPPPSCPRSGFTIVIVAHGGRILTGHAANQPMGGVDTSICEAPDLPGMIGCGAAIHVAVTEGGPGGGRMPDEADLSPDYRRTPNADPQPVWIVVWHRVDIGPADGPAHGPQPPHVVGTWGLVVDAVNGEFIAEGFSTGRDSASTPPGPRATEPNGSTRS